MNATTTKTALDITKKVGAGWQYRPDKKFYTVKEVQSKRAYIVLPDDWEAFFVENGFVSKGAVMGYIEAPIELYKEAAFFEGS
ncbi:hypothetical protein HUG15_00280 [Salicibibacter cibarius]|uniref:Uncharacterized protein n=1 Tax=Salicibibacter cibarius TaxID=2743000 RepID=A0A7T6YZJ0_9BACI|nr:hypothetical protein [Salicibibacter cibarius]QQK74205.1 hypothetical protein HUG15_00280 [Salicibibacter cibarius]